MIRAFLAWRRRWDSPKGLGRRGERLAARHLKRHGLRVLARNVRSGPGEIDLIAVDGTTLVFVEVKSYTSCAAVEATGLEKLDRRKQTALRRSCWTFARRLRCHPESVRGDVVVVEFSRLSRRVPHEIRWYPGGIDL